MEGEEERGWGKEANRKGKCREELKVGRVRNKGKDR